MNFFTPINVTVPPMLAIPTTEQPIQPSSTGQINQISSVNEGILVLLLFLSYICIGFGYKKYQKKRAATRQERLKTLERIWKLTARPRELDSR